MLHIADCKHADISLQCPKLTHLSMEDCSELGHVSLQASLVELSLVASFPFSFNESVLLHKFILRSSTPGWRNQLWTASALKVLGQFQAELLRSGSKINFE